MIDRAMKQFVKPFKCHFALKTIGSEKNTAFLLVRIQLLVVKKLDPK